jgi:NodT family efflux transporter outer membrane factor (OMF) lipoprotein
MFAKFAPRLAAYLAMLGFLIVQVCGCTSLSEYIHNGFKVGPNYGRPPAPVEKEWIDANDKRVRSESEDLSQWWTVFNDPVLNSLICYAYRQNLPLRVAGFRVLEARAQLGIDIGNIFPQTQQATGDYKRTGLSTETANNFLGTNLPAIPGLPRFQRFYSQWDFGFNLTWELDFWGRFRRAIESGEASLDASVENYDDVLVTLLGDVASNYVTFRTLQERIKYTRDNVELQRETLRITEARLKAGTLSEFDVAQARSTLEQTESQIPELLINLRITGNQLCILLGIPPEELESRLGSAPIPVAPPDVAAGIPADLLRRRPDVRRAEREAAAQCAQIGVAESDFYPHIFINGTMGYSAEEFKNVFQSKAFNGTIGPSFQWNILNYGRILNNVRLQDAKFQELVANYQNSVLNAFKETENGIVTFLRAQERTKLQASSVEDADKAVKIAIVQYKAGTIDLVRVTQLEQTLVGLQDTLAQARGEIDLGLIQVYKAMGGGWEIRLNGCETDFAPRDHNGTVEAAPPPPVYSPATKATLARPGARAGLGVPVGQ